ncbi:MAG: 6-phosphogluconolactonase, partial [Elioraea tepidiphila]
DGHFASLFPGATNLGEALAFDNADDVCVIHPDPLPPEAPFARVSLTAARLLRSRTSWLAITGERKLSALRDAQTTRDPQRLPIAALLHAPQAHLHIHWSP